MRAFGLVALLLALAAFAAARFASAAPTTTHRAGAGRAVIVYGYPYASRCPAAGYADAVDRWRMEMCNCTSYVAWALAANGQRTDWFIPGAMNAWNWPHVARLRGLRVGARPRLRSVVVWPKLAQPFGHVAYVTGIERNGGIDVSEYNLPQANGFEPFDFDRRYDVSPSDGVFIYVPRRDSGVWRPAP